MEKTETEGPQATRRRRFPEALAVPLPEGASARMQAVAVANGLHRAEWMRARLMAALEVDERKVAARRKSQG